MHSIKNFSFLFLCFLVSTMISACGSKSALYQDEPSNIVEKNSIETPKQVTEKLKKQP